MAKSYKRQLEDDNADLRYLLGTVFRCPVCSHLYREGWICATCGADEGIYEEGGYTKEEIKEMKKDT